MSRYSRYLITVVVGFLFAAMPGARVAQASDWMWSITPYLWGPSMNLSLEVNDQDVGGGQVNMPDVIDALEFAFAAHLEGQRGRNGLFADSTSSTSRETTRATIWPARFRERLWFRASSRRPSSR